MPRKTFEGARLVEELSRLSEADRLSPPAARPSLMGVVRAFAAHIETRARLGWTDPMIAAVLTEAGYPIDAATLRSYRKRLRDEGLLPPLGSSRANGASVLPLAARHVTGALVPAAPRASVVESASTRGSAEARGRDAADAVATSQPALPAVAELADARPTPLTAVHPTNVPVANVEPASSAPPARPVEIQSGTPRAPPAPAPSGRRSYAVNRAKLPADHA